jgi:hypothetical protein
MKKMSRKEKIIYSLLVVFGVIMTLAYIVFGSRTVPFAIVGCTLLAVVGFLCYVFLKKVMLPAIFVGCVPLAIALLLSFFLISSSDGGIFVLSLALAIPVFSFLLIFMMLGGWIAMLIYKIRGSKTVECLPEESEQNSEEDCVDNEKISLRLNIIIYTAFALALLVINFLIFLFNIEAAYKPDEYGWIIVPAYYEVVYYSVGISLVFYFVAFIIWAIFALFNKKINIVVLLILALLIPCNQTDINRYLFDEEGPLYSTVQKGGMLFFVVTRDFDLDGEYDEKYRLIYDDREVVIKKEDGIDGIDDRDKTEIDYIEVRIIGRGAELEHCSAHSRRFESSFDKSVRKCIYVSSAYNTTVESVEIYVTPRKNKDPQKFEFEGFKIDITSEVLDDGRIKLTVDPEEISRREKESERHSMSFDINFDYKE